jgi:hypothetical protein
MQYVSCKVLLGGDRNFAIPKPLVSVAEVIVLRALHGGDDAVVDIVPIGQRSVRLRDELVRLIGVYGQRPEAREVVERVFANAHIRGITTLGDLTPDQVEDAPDPLEAETLTADDLVAAGALVGEIGQDTQAADMGEAEPFDPDLREDLSGPVEDDPVAAPPPASVRAPIKGRR